MAKQQIGLLFGMSGEGKIDGASGARIKSQLQSIVNELNRSSTTKIKFQYEFDVKKVEKEINNATKKAAEPKTSKYSKGLVNYYKDLEKQSDSFNKKNINGIDFEIKKREEASKRFSSQIKAQIKENDALYGGIAKSIDAQISQREKEGKQFSAQIKLQMTERAKADKLIADLKKQAHDSSITLAGMGGNADKRQYGNVQAVAKEYKEYVRLVNEAKAAVKNNDGSQAAMQDIIDKTNAAVEAQMKLNAAFDNATAFDKQALSYNKVIARITEYQAKYKETLKNTPELAAQLEELNQQLAGGTFTGTESDAQNRFVQLTNDIRKAGGEAETLGQKIRRIFGEKLGYGIIASTAMMARRAVREVYNNVVELDNAVVNLQIATGKNREETKELVDTYSDLGRELGATTKEVANAADTWLNKIGLLYRDIQL